MENVAQFDLNLALQHWLQRLGQSPQVKAENLQELESHVRDSVVQLEGKGLSAEESFLVATHRVGSVEKLEPEFAKVNRNPRQLIVPSLILLFFSVGCWLLWGLLHFPDMVMAATKGEMFLPAFTKLVVELRAYLVVPPVLAAAYLVCAWFWKSKNRSSWVGFFASTIAALVLLTLPILIAVLLPMIAFIHHASQ
jgi:hypothetical protein